MSESTGGYSCTYQLHSLLHHTLSIFGFENADVSLMIFKLFQLIKVVLCVKYFLCPFSNSHTLTHEHTLRNVTRQFLINSQNFISSLVSHLVPSCLHVSYFTAFGY